MQFLPSRQYRWKWSSTGFAQTVKITGRMGNLPSIADISSGTEWMRNQSCQIGKLMESCGHVE